MTSKTMPHSVHAAYDKKGKMKEVEVKIVSVEKAASGFLVHLALPLSKHHQTLIHLD